MKNSRIPHKVNESFFAADGRCAMKTKIFRKDAMNQITSPENLDSYIRVTTPSIWLLVCAILAFLTGITIWGIFGHLDTTIHGTAVVKNGTMECYVKAEDVARLKKGLQVTVNGKNYTMQSPSKEPIRITRKKDSYFMQVGNFKDGEWVYKAGIGDTDASDGIYDAKIVIERIAPVKFLLN